MNLADTIYQQVKTLPPPLAREVLDFVAFLQARRNLDKPAFRGQGKGGAAYAISHVGCVSDSVTHLFGCQMVRYGAMLRLRLLRLRSARAAQARRA